MPPGSSLLDILRARAADSPLNITATVIFFLAIVHTFLTARFTDAAHAVQRRRAARGAAPASPSLLAEALLLLGEVEVVFGLWVVPLIVAMTAESGWDATTRYLNDTVNYTEALFVVVIMALASTRPIITLAEGVLRRLAAVGRATPAAWWLTILIVGPLLGSFMTEPAAMAICALLLSRQFFDLDPSDRLKYATLGLLFVNVSVGGTLTHFAAPPVLMVARQWGWDTAFMFMHVGWRAMLAVILSTVVLWLLFRREFRDLARRGEVRDVEIPDEDAVGSGAELLPVPAWIILVHVAFMTWTVVNAHYPALFIGGFLFFLGFTRATASYQSRVALKAPLLVGFFLGGLVIHGGLQAWWIGPTLRYLSEAPLFAAATVLTAFNDNALITYLGTLVPDLEPQLKMALVQGAVTGGGLTVIANAPNPVGQALLGRFFDHAVHPWRLFIGAVLPTLVAVAAFRLL
ncbi:MAG TPA: putative Na+/H+ antiporter [Vicinamibacterales bacterium]|nr:putative Na+/H+ antiporter [Vicinamibacterales bacterium]